MRGGLVYADRASRERPEVKGFVSATRGNHGQSLAYAGRAAGLRVVIVVPEGNSPDKNAAMRGFGAELVVHGRDYQEAREHAMGLEAELGLEAVPAVPPRPRAWGWAPMPSSCSTRPARSTPSTCRSGWVRGSAG